MYMYVRYEWAHHKVPIADPCCWIGFLRRLQSQSLQYYMLLQPLDHSLHLVLHKVIYSKLEFHNHPPQLLINFATLRSQHTACSELHVVKHEEPCHAMHGYRLDIIRNVVYCEHLGSSCMVSKRRCPHLVPVPMDGFHAVVYAWWCTFLCTCVLYTKHTRAPTDEPMPYCFHSEEDYA
jgi:hypothetical protein